MPEVCWLKRLFADEDLTRPLPKYWTYALASLAAGDVRPASGALLAPGALVPSPAGRPRNDLVAVHAAATDPDGLGWIVTREPERGAMWIMAWRHDETPTADDALTAPPVVLHVTLPPSARGRVEALAIGGDDGDVWRVDPWGATPVRARLLAPNDDLVLTVAPERVQVFRVESSVP